jgi:hypothetical protein
LVTPRPVLPVEALARLLALIMAENPLLLSIAGLTLTSCRQVEARLASGDPQMAALFARAYGEAREDCAAGLAPWLFRGDAPPAEDTREVIGPVAAVTEGPIARVFRLSDFRARGGGGSQGTPGPSG